MDKLTEKGFWDDQYRSETHQPTGGFSLKRFVKKLLGPNFTEAAKPYHDYLAFEVIYPTYLPQTPGTTLLEIGSAPGEFLAKMARKFQYDVYGVEYTASGVDVNRAFFKNYGIPEDHVVLADFFDKDFQSEHAEKYDIVLSRGFIEHFSDPRDVVRQHLGLVRPGGYLVISIPHLLGWNYATTRFWDSPLFPLHNLEVMKLENFREAFNIPGLELRFCDYFGSITVSAVGSTNKAWKRPLQALCFKLQMLTNIVQRWILGKRGIGSRLFAPQLLFIGFKKPD